MNKLNDIDEKIDAISDETIEALLAEAGDIGDEELIATCRSALEGSRTAKRICVRVLDAALAMRD